MARLIEFPLEGGGSILVEAEAPEGGTVRVGADGERIAEKARVTFEQAIARLRPAAERLIAVLRESADAPDSIGVEFGIDLSSTAGALVAAVGAKANFKVTLTWNRRTP